MRRRIPHLISLTLLAVVGVYFWGTAVSTAWARLAALQTIEPYAFAVHEQLMVNYATGGEFFQTIHRGYEDSWTWSGHRALTLPVTALLYGLDPHPLWLAQIMLLSVLLGVIPAALLGQRTIGSGLGLAWGGLIYLMAPVTMIMALQDYQDLIYALPFLVFAIWAISSGKWWLTILGAIIVILPREECVPMGIVIAMLCPPWDAKRRRLNWRMWAFNIVVTLSVAGVYTGWADRHYPLEASSDNYTMPMLNAIKSATGESGGGYVFLEGWIYMDVFYSLLWIPLGFLMIGAPNLALPAAGLILFHMSVPEGMGIDRSWSGHSHHMAPTAAFLLASIIQGGGRLLRFIAGRGRLRGGVAVMVGAGLLLWSGQHWQQWSGYHNLVTGFTPQTPVWVHPVWPLVRALPSDAAPIASKDASIAISNFVRSYTYDESLHHKAAGEGLGVGTHLIADTRKEKLIAWAMAMPGAEVVEESEPYVLITWNDEAEDGFADQKLRIKRGQFWTGPYNKASDIPGVPPHEKRLNIQQGSFPVLKIP